MATQTHANELTITRTFNAPRPLVWKAWTDPELYRKWWGPSHFTCPVTHMDLRVGGKYHSCMRSPDGQDFWSAGFYQEISPYDRLVFTDSFADAEGNIVPASYYGMSDMPLEMLVTITLEEQDGKTVMTLVHSGLPAGEHGYSAKEGWNQSFEKLAEIVELARTTNEQGRKVTPFLMFKDRAEEAVRFYVSLFANARITQIDHVGGDAEGQGSLAMISFEIDGQPLMAMDGGPSFSFAEGNSLYINCTSQEEVDRLYDGLSEGGEKQPCGWVKDRYGLSWQIVPTQLVEMMQDPDPQKAGRVVQSMLKMHKIDIAELQRAHAGE